METQAAAQRGRWPELRARALQQVQGEKLRHSGGPKLHTSEARDMLILEADRDHISGIPFTPLLSVKSRNHKKEQAHRPQPKQSQ